MLFADEQRIRKSVLNFCKLHESDRRHLSRINVLTTVRAFVLTPADERAEHKGSVGKLNFLCVFWRFEHDRLIGRWIAVTHVARVVATGCRNMERGATLFIAINADLWRRRRLGQR